MTHEGMDETKRSSVKDSGEELVIFRRLAEASGYGFCVADLRCSIVFVNMALCRMLGENHPSDAIGKNLLDYLPEAARDSFAINIIPMVVKEGQWVGELPVRSSSGVTTPTMQNVFSVHGVTGDQPYFANLVMDITDRKRAEEALRNSERRFRDLVENITDAVYTLDEKGVITYISSAIEGIMGYGPAELIGRSASDFVRQEDREILAKALMGDQITQPGIDEFRMLTKDLGTRAVSVSRRPLMKGDRLVGIQGILTDVTEQRISQEALQKSEEKFSRAFMMSPDGMFIMRLFDGMIMEANASFLSMMEANRGELIGQPARGLDLWAQVRERESFLRMLKRTGTVSDLEVTLLTNDGAHHPVLLTAQTIELDGVPCALAVVRDLTRLRWVEQSVRIQRDLAIKLNASRSLEETLHLCLNAALQLGGMDSGGIYLVDDESGELNLAIATGLSPDFLSRSSYYSPDSPSAKLVMKGEPVYQSHAELGIPIDDVKLAEGLRIMAVIPILHEGQVIACMNVASHILTEMPQHARDALETIGAQIGGVITRARVAEAKRDSDDRYRTLFSTMREGVWLCRVISDEAGRAHDCELVNVNPAFEIILGIPRAKAVGQRVCRLFGPAFAEYIPILERVATTSAPHTMELKLRPKMPRVRISLTSPKPGYVAAVFSPVEGPPGLSMGPIDKIMEVAKEAIILLDPRGSLVAISAGFERMTGYRREELLGKAWYTIAEGIDDHIVEEARAAMVSGEPWHIRLSAPKKDLAPIQFEVNAVPITDDDGQLYVLLAVLQEVKVPEDVALPVGDQGGNRG